MKAITMDDFKSVELRVGTITEAEDLPETRKPAYIIKVDFGTDIGIRKTSSRITESHEKDELIGKQIIGLVNVSPKQIGHIISEFLFTGFCNKENNVILAVPNKEVPNGSTLF